MAKRRWIPLFAILGVLLAACGGDGSEPTATPQIVNTATVENAPTQDLASLDGSTATDGICQLTIPDEWVDDGTGRGVTAQGDHWSIFGGAIASDSAWESAKDLLKSQLSGREGVQIQDDGDVITATSANGRGLVMRERFDNRYCEFAVTAATDRTEDVTAVWAAVSETIALLRKE